MDWGNLMDVRATQVDVPDYFFSVFRHVTLLSLEMWGMISYDRWVDFM